MNRPFLVPALLLCLLILMPVHAAAKDSWISVRSKNFLLVGNASDKDIRKVATQLEQFRDVFSRLFPNAATTSPVPTTVIVFKSDSSYKPFKPLYQGKPANVSGYFQSGEDANYITLTTETGAENPYRTIFHEYVHLLVRNTLPTSLPVWMNEGLAEYYSTFEIEDNRKAQLGRVIPNHVLLLREKFIPLRALLAVGADSPLYNERDKQSIFYAEAWALMHYLILGNDGARRQQVGDFIGKSAANMPLDEAFQESFKTDYAGLEKELRDYVKRNSYPGQVATFNQKLEFDTQMQSAPITEAEAQFYLGDLLLHINRLDDAAPRLQQALSLDENLGAAHASLGIMLMRQKQFAAAKEHLERAIAASPQSYLTHYYYAYALSREGMDDGQFVAGYPENVAAKIRAELRKAMELNSNFPESYHLLAFVNLVANEQIDHSIGLIKRAIALAPGHQEYAFVLAQLYLRKQDFKAARQILEPLARNASNGTDTQLRGHAQSLLNSVASYEAQVALYKSHRNASPDTNGEAPTTIERAEKGSSGEDAQAARQPPNEKSLRQAAVQHALGKTVEGEMRARGLLTRIDCDAKGATVSVKVGERVLKLRSDDLANVGFVSYAKEMSDRITCGVRNPANHIVVTYRPIKNGNAKIDGELASIAFVPEDFELKQ